MKHNVLPLDDRQIERINSDMAGRPVLVKGNSQILLAGMGRLSENSVIDIKNKSFAVGGWCLYAKGGTVTLYCDGKEIGKGRVEQTQGFIFSAVQRPDQLGADRSWRRRQGRRSLHRPRRTRAGHDGASVGVSRHRLQSNTAEGDQWA